MTDHQSPEQLASGWEALRAGAWSQARDSFEAEAARAETGAALDGLARSRWWLADVPGAIEAWERAYGAYRRAGEDAAAARTALFLSKGTHAREPRRGQRLAGPGP